MVRIKIRGVYTLEDSMYTFSPIDNQLGYMLYTSTHLFEVKCREHKHIDSSWEHTNM